MYKKKISWGINNFIITEKENQVQEQENKSNQIVSSMSSLSQQNIQIFSLPAKTPDRLVGKSQSGAIVDEGQQQQNQVSQMKRISFLPMMFKQGTLADIQEQDEPESSKRKSETNTFQNINPNVPFKNLDFVNLKSESKKPLKKIPIFQTPQSVSKQMKTTNPPISCLSEQKIELKIQEQPQESLDTTEAVLKYIRNHLDQIKTFNIPINQDDMSDINRQLDKMIQAKQLTIQKVSQQLENFEIPEEEPNEQSRQDLNSGPSSEWIRSNLVQRLGYKVRDFTQVKQNEWTIQVFFYELKIMLYIQFEYQSKKIQNRQNYSFLERFQNCFSDMYNSQNQIINIRVEHLDQFQEDQSDVWSIVQKYLTTFKCKRLSHTLLSGLLNSFRQKITQIKNLYVQLKESEQYFGVISTLENNTLTIYYGHRFHLKEVINQLNSKNDLNLLGKLRERTIFSLEIDIISLKYNKLLLRQKYSLGYLSKFFKKISFETLQNCEEDPDYERDQQLLQKAVEEILNQLKEDSLLNLFQLLQRYDVHLY